MLTVIFVWLGSFQVQAADTVLERERVSIVRNDVTVKQVLKEMEKQSKLRFFYNHQQVDVERTVDVNFEGISMREALEEVFAGTQVRYQSSGRHIVLFNGSATSSSAVGYGADVLFSESEFIVTGKVVSETGEALPGVNVVIKGTSSGVSTDTDGKYTIDVPGGESTLVFSFIGYNTEEIAVNNRNVIDVVLEADLTTLEEVVVVGYGTQSRQNVTGSVAKVDMKATQDLPNTNITQSLRGRVAGVQFVDDGRPGQGGQILIRGQRSISANNNPLIILDGIFYNGNLADINPNDVESMEILKDASAGAIYGARAANGVILITTKRGKSATPTIRVNAYAGTSDWSNRVDLLSPERYLEARLDFREQTGQVADPAAIADYLQPTERENYLAGRTLDPWDEIAQTGSIQNYDLSISGATEKTNYFISGVYTTEKGLLYNDNADRIAMRVNLENNIKDWLKIGVNAQFSKRDLSGIEPNRGFAYWLSPYASLYYNDDKSDPVPLPQDDGLVNNPMFDAIFNRNEEIAYNLFSNLYAVVNVPFVEGLSFRLNYSPNYRWDHNYTTTPLYQRNGQNRLGSAEKFNREVFDWVLENIVTYARTIGDHDFDATLLYGRNHFGSEQTTARGANYFNDDLGWNNLGLAVTQQVSSGATVVEGISSMLRLNYRFKNRYLLTLTGRRDGSSVFGAENKFAFFPSAAVGWVMSEENFINNISGINFLKLRASYGTVGNQAIDPYQSLARSGTTQIVYGDGSGTFNGTFPLTMANPNLSWETTTSANVAVDFEIMNSRIGGTVEYYNMNTTDLLLRRSLPVMTGFTEVFTNVGETKNTGVEITLNTVNVRQNKFEWSSNFVFSTNKNEIVHLYRSDINGDGVEDDDLGNAWFIGEPINVEFDYVTDGIYQVDDEIPTGFQPGFFRLTDLDGDGVITPADRQVVGQRDPKYRWGLTNTFRYGNFTLSVFINAMQGYISRLNALSTANPNNFPGRANFLDAGWWTESNRSNTRPSLAYTNPRGHQFYGDRDFVRIQDVSLSYEVPASVLSKLKVSNLRIYLSGKNLATFTDWKGFDPENAPRDGIGFPTARSIVGGVNLTF